MNHPTSSYLLFSPVHSKAMSNLEENVAAVINMAQQLNWEEPILQLTTNAELALKIQKQTLVGKVWHFLI